MWKYSYSVMLRKIFFTTVGLANFMSYYLDPPLILFYYLLFVTCHLYNCEIFFENYYDSRIIDSYFKTWVHWNFPHLFELLLKSKQILNNEISSSKAQLLQKEEFGRTFEIILFFNLFGRENGVQSEWWVFLLKWVMSLRALMLILLDWIQMCVVHWERQNGEKSRTSEEPNPACTWILFRQAIRFV